MNLKITSFFLLLSFITYAQQIDTETRDNASASGANFKSGFFQTLLHKIEELTLYVIEQNKRI